MNRPHDARGDRFGSAFGPSRELRSRVKLLPEYARAHNRALVLQTLYHAGELSRADLARETGLTRVTISDLVSELIADEIVKEKGTRESSGPGKPATLIDIDRGGHQIIGIDLSGPSRFEGAVMNLDGEVIARDTIDRPPGDDGEAGFAGMLELARRMIAASDRPILGVGIGTQGVVSADGVVLSSPNLGWQGMPLRDRTRDELDLPVIVGNDANAAVLAEYTFGGDRSDFMLIKVGRGVGAGLITGGQPLTGSRFAAGEIGHVVVGTDGGPRCVCGRDGCLEAWVNVVRLRSAIAESPASREEILRDAGARLAIGIAPIVAALDLSDIILSGPAELLDDVFIAAALETLHERTLDGVFDDITIHRTVQPDIVLHGAAVMVLAAQLGIS
ncbi:ROK family transcriptional regulator [Microbacterium esteraromaticum]|uniref:ROK family transcriptional regulator n=1 Tax=Microbacterium esteraromaticum TaxID=57043 RepID=UPI001CD72D4D|nr:ROK family transcriptional regulator [Microbacterium esteraromaticum]MCA1305518.1 ROK family transcriptional regulator [Microbacterium esteraromaticum]